MVGACDGYEGKQKRIQAFDGETGRKETVCKNSSHLPVTLKFVDVKILFQRYKRLIIARRRISVT